MKRILELSNIEARKFLLKEESYFNFDLPFYFTFSKLLQKLSKKLEDSNLSDFYSNCTDNHSSKNNPRDFEGVNYKLIHNKNGQYDWRLFQLINPAIYVSLVHKITEKENWKTIINKFKQFENNSVESLGIPVVSENNTSDKATQVKSWIQNVEQKSISLSLDFEYLFQTDIVDCYNSIYTHSIPWALHTKEVAKKKENRNNNILIGVAIDQHIQDMSNGQTNGIPQGSILMDFIAEIVLGYVDLELTNKIKDKYSENTYKILRYRDDYRIFVNNPQIGEEIIKDLTEVLSQVGMKLSTEKTKFSNNVISSSIKEDKLYFIENYKHSTNIQNEILNINSFAKKYTNSGSLVKLLQIFFNKIKHWEYTHQNIRTIISILVNIMYKNPRIYPIATSILSKFLSLLDGKNRKEILNKILEKISKVPNTEHLELWMQRITIKYGYDDLLYKSKLCEKVINNKIEIWNTKWLNEGLQKIINSNIIIDKKKLEEMGISIKSEEVSLFEKKNQYPF